MKSVFFSTVATVAASSFRSLPKEPVVYTADVFPARIITEDNDTWNNDSGLLEPFLESKTDMKLLEKILEALLRSEIEVDMLDSQSFESDAGMEKLVLYEAFSVSMFKAELMNNDFESFENFLKNNIENPCPLPPA